MQRPQLVATVALAIAATVFGIAVATFIGKRAVPQGPQIRGDFSLVREDGSDIPWHDTGGVLRLVFFGFTNCPDTCPVMLAKTASALDAIGAPAASIHVYFITVDPERDTPAVIRKYVSPFGGRVVGFTGSAGQIAAAAKAFGVYYSKLPMADGNYMMEHASTVFVVDAADGLREIIPADTPLADLTERLRVYTR